MEELQQKAEGIFQPEKKCIVNADLDGILSGMFLQKFLQFLRNSLDTELTFLPSSLAISR